jgi:dephospho-CoA kinase
MASGQPRWALIGGIGSGKSEVRRILETLGIRTIDADSVGHDVLTTEALAPVAERWPEVVVDGVIDRARLAAIVFSDGEQLRALEGITHPIIFGRIRQDLQGYPGVAVVELPLLEGIPGWKRIVVDARDELRLRRAVERGMAPADAARRLAMQPSRAEWLARADLVITNHGDRRDLHDSVSRLVGSAALWDG